MLPAAPALQGSPGPHLQDSPRPAVPVSRSAVPASLLQDSPVLPAVPVSWSAHLLREAPALSRRADTAVSPIGQPSRTTRFGIKQVSNRVEVYYIISLAFLATYLLDGWQIL